MVLVQFPLAFCVQEGKKNSLFIDSKIIIYVTFKHFLVYCYINKKRNFLKGDPWRQEETLDKIVRQVRWRRMQSILIKGAPSHCLAF